MQKSSFFYAGVICSHLQNTESNITVIVKARSHHPILGSEN